MTVWIKQGVLGDLTTTARKGLGKVETLYSSKGYDLYITSLREGNHSPGSLHYNGNAFDIRKVDKISATDIQNVLGKDWDVVSEPSHMHIEYDPKDN